MFLCLSHSYSRELPLSANKSALYCLPRHGSSVPANGVFFPQVCSPWVEIDLHVFFCAAWWLAHVTQQCCSKCVDTNSNCWVSSVVCCCSALLCCHAVSSHPWRFFSKLQHHISSTAVQAATAPHCSTWCMRACSTAMHESRHGP